MQAKVKASDTEGQSGVELSHQFIAKANGTLIVPVCDLDDVTLGVRVYCEPHDASEVRS